MVSVTEIHTGFQLYLCLFDLLPCFASYYRERSGVFFSYYGGGGGTVKDVPNTEIMGKKTPLCCFCNYPPVNVIQNYLHILLPSLSHTLGSGPNNVIFFTWAPLEHNSAACGGNGLLMDSMQHLLKIVVKSGQVCEVPLCGCRFRHQ